MKLTLASEARKTFAAARRRINAFTIDGTFVEACALVVGFNSATDGQVLTEFQSWLGDRHDGRSELAFWVLVMREAFPTGDDRRPSGLTPGENRIAVDKLFELLDECLDSLT
jgi:hypothetical protein